MPKKKSKKPVKLDEDETPSEPVEEYSHGSLAKGDTPPPWVATAIADVLKDNPYKDMPQLELVALARSLYEAQEQLRLVQAVLMARNSVW